MDLKTSTILLLTIFSCFLVRGQTESSNEEDEYVLTFDSLETKDKINFNFEAGVNVGSSGNFGTFYSPSVSYQISPKFSVESGFVYQNSSVNNYPVIEDYRYQSFSGSINQYAAFVSGKYNVTDKLTVGGSLYYDLTSYETSNGIESYSNNNSNSDNIGYSASFEYRVTKNMTISGEIRRGGSNNPYNRYGCRGFNSSFGNNFGSSYPFRNW